MSPSVQCRTLSLAPNYPDTVVTTADIPYDLGDDLGTHLAEWLGLIRSSAISYNDFLTLAKRIPPHASTSRTRPQAGDLPAWLSTNDSLVAQALKLQLAGPGLLFQAGGQLFLNGGHHDLGLDALERWQADIKANTELIHENGWDELKADYAAALSMELDGFFVSRYRFEEVERLIPERIYGAEIPFSHSPALGAITLQDLLRGGIRSACLLPLATGLWSATNSIASGQLVSAFQVTLGGGGITICAIGTLWVADKLLNGIKNFTDSEAHRSTRKPKA